MRYLLLARQTPGSPAVCLLDNSLILYELLFSSGKWGGSLQLKGTLEIIWKYDFLKQKVPACFAGENLPMRNQQLRASVHTHLWALLSLV